MIDTINAIKRESIDGKEKVLVRCPVCGKVSVFFDSKREVVPEKAVCYDLHCADCNAVVGSFSNLS